MPALAGMSLQVCDASFRTPQGSALIQPLSFSVAPGQRLAIVGPNGAGKSTLLRMLGGLLAPTTGHVLLDGEPLQHMAPVVRARTLAILGQADHADVRLRVQDYVALGCLPHRQTQSPTQLRGVVADALALCNLTALATRAMGSLSGGERQRAHLARALAQQPRLLLLDEPTNHLDPRATLDLLRMVKDLGITVVAVLHDLPLVPPWADQVLVLKAGALVRCDTPTLALNPVTVHQVFAMHSYYLPDPGTAQPMLVLDAHPPDAPAGSPPHHRTSFFNHYEEPTP
nr:ABC transporter ATP-binding protein [uncultured Rhodoferax sp.]